MAKGFILAITTAMILVIVVLYMQNFSANQTRDLDRISQMLVAEKVAHTWADVREDISIAAMLLIDKNNNTATFYDYLPAPPGTVSNFLSLYGRFVEEYYETPDTDIKFLSPDGTPMDLGNLPARITILPYNLEYYYPDYDWAKRELFLDIPSQNFSFIKKVNMTMNFTNAQLNCTCTPGGPNACRKFTPDVSSCKQTTTYCINFTISVADYAGRYCNILDEQIDIGGKAVENLHVEGSFVKIHLGPFDAEPLIWVDIQGLQINATTQLILNTSDFYISYLSKLAVHAVNYNTSRVDWA